MSGTKIPNVSNLFRETKYFNSCVRINACVTQFLKIRAISSTAVFQVLAMQSVMRYASMWCAVVQQRIFSDDYRLTGL